MILLEFVPYFYHGSVKRKLLVDLVKDDKISLC